MTYLSFLFPIFLTGILIILPSSFLGSFVLWRRMSYYGDSLAHSSILGIAIGIIAGINSQIAIFCFALLFSVIFTKKNKSFSNDTILGILSYANLACALIIVSFAKIKIDLMGYLFGDLLLASYEDALKIFLFDLVLCFWLKKNFSKLIQLCISEEILQTDGVNVSKLNLQLVMFLSFFIATSFKIVGALLIGALMIIPCAAAQKISKRPFEMMINSLLISAISFILGLLIALKFDLPTSPSIIICSTGILLIVNMLAKLIASE